MEIHSTERSNASAQTFVFANFPGDKEWICLIRKVWTSWFADTQQLVVQHVEAEDAHVGHSYFDL